MIPRKGNKCLVFLLFHSLITLKTDILEAKLNMQKIFQDASGLTSATLTYDDSDGLQALEGFIEFEGEVHAYTIENCGENCHVLIQVSSYKGETKTSETEGGIIVQIQN